MESVECVVVGAGVVGLAIARELARAGREVIVIEAQDTIGSGISSRNSEVIHAGIYYPAGSLMARLCVAGRALLYAYCAERDIAHRRCGKLIVATTEEEAGRLHAIKARAEVNGVDDIVFLTGSEARAAEPALNAVAALLSPSTGIFDSHGYMQALRADAEGAGATFAFHAPFASAAPSSSGLAVNVGGKEPMRLGCRLLINAAGLGAIGVARAIAGLPGATIPMAYFAKGNYFACTARPPFRRLIYPVPVPGGLGVHLTLDLAGQARFGPDVEWIPEPDYAVDPARADRFYPAIRRYWPGLPDGALAPAFAGVRPKIVPPEIAAQDFTIRGPRDHGVAGLVNLFGIESPGLTSSLAIARHVSKLI
jgi:L-2-hydroxyglutarate oxidase LhgO